MRAPVPPAAKTPCKPVDPRYFSRSLFMAKTSWINRNERKRETVEKYAALRAELKAKKDYIGLSAVAAQCEPDPCGQPLPGQRPPARLHPPLQSFAPRLPRARFRRVNPGRDEVELVASPPRGAGFRVRGLASASMSILFHSLFASASLAEAVAEHWDSPGVLFCEARRRSPRSSS